MGGLIKAITLIGSLLIQFTSYIEFYNDYIYNLFIREHAIQEHKLNISKMVSSLTKNTNRLKKDAKNSTDDISVDKLTRNKLEQIKQNNFLKQIERPSIEDDKNDKIQRNSFRKIFTGINQTNFKYPTGKAFKEFLIQLCFCSKNNIKKSKRTLN